MANEEPVADAKISKGRSPAYPYVSLEKAVEKAERIAAAGVGRNAYPPETFYKIWGSGAQSSSSRQTMAALNHFGLVQYVGRGKERKIVLSDLARKIVMDKIPNSAARLKALQEAALEPPIYFDLWERYGPILPDDIVLATYLTMERDYNNEAVKPLIDCYRDTLRYSGLDKPDDKPDDKPESFGDVEESKAGQFEIGDHVFWESAGQLQWREPFRISDVQKHEDGNWFLKVEGTGEYVGQGGWIPMSQAIAADVEDIGSVRRDIPQPPQFLPVLPEKELGKDLIEEKNSLDEGEAILICPKNLSEESVEDLEYWLRGIVRKARRRAGMVSEKDKGGDDNYDL